MPEFESSSNREAVIKRLEKLSDMLDEGYQYAKTNDIFEYLNDVVRLGKAAAEVASLLKSLDNEGEEWKIDSVLSKFDRERAFNSDDWTQTAKKRIYNSFRIFRN
jgi:hypothetical protein